MLLNYLLSAWRNIGRQKTFSAINIFGLALGLACCLILISFVRQEFSYDQFHTQADKVFRVNQIVGGEDKWAWTGGAVGPLMAREFDEVEQAVRIHLINTYIAPEGGDERFRENRFAFADDGFFELFDFPLVEGTATGVLEEPYQILLTEEMAKKYFGEESPIGKSLITTGDFTFVVKGVLKDIPTNTHMKFDFLTSMASFKVTEGFPVTAEIGSFWWPNCYTYVKVKEPMAVEAINQRTVEVFKKARPAEEAEKYVPFLQSIKEIHLDNSLQNDWTPSTPKSTVYIFLSIGVFILLLACINFINLSTARATKRIKEIGVRKVTGAQRGQLVQQFFIESFLINLLALVLALGMVQLLAPLFSGLLQQELHFSLGDVRVWIFLSLVLFASTFLSGFFPALYLSGMRPNLIMSDAGFRSHKSNLRQSLVVLQFALSGILVFSATIAYFQQAYLRDADLGFQKENILSISMGEASKANKESLSDAFEQFSFVEKVVGSSIRPGVDPGWSPNLAFEGQDPNTQQWVQHQYIDFNYFEMLDVPMIAGREFSREFQDQGESFLMRERFPATRDGSFVINESLAKLMDLTPEEVIGKSLEIFTEEGGNRFFDFHGKVVGVVKDFHTSDLRFAIRPTVFSPVKTGLSDNSSHLLVKLVTEDLEYAAGILASKWKDINPTVPFEYTVLEDSLSRQYDQENRLSNLLGVFALLTLVISSLGLLGLSIFMAEGRKKEIGIRKVMGASAASITQELTRDFLKPVIISMLIALPLGYFIMKEWLGQFAYRIEMQAGFFFLTFMLAVMIAWLTVAVQSWKAATDNPVDALRTE